MVCYIDYFLDEWGTQEELREAETISNSSVVSSSCAPLYSVQDDKHRGA